MRQFAQDDLAEDTKAFVNLMRAAIAQLEQATKAMLISVRQVADKGLDRATKLLLVFVALIEAEKT